VFFLSDKDGPLSLYRMEADGTGVAPVGSETDIAGACISWSGSAVVYEKWSLYADIYRMGSDGSSPTLVYQGGQDSRNPCMSPDGQFVIFSMVVGSVPQLFRTTIAGADLTQLTNENEGVGYARYSPDGTKIVFSTAAGDIDVKIMNADGTGIAPLASGSTEQDMPAFSPDGAKVVYMENFGTALSPVYQLMVVDATGGTPVRVTTTMLDDRSPCFSQDGNYILFTRPDGGFREIFRMPVGGGTEGQVTDFNAFTWGLCAPGP
jgi:TolB protein